MKQAYIGVTGIKTLAQVNAINKIAREYNLPVAQNILCSTKRLLDINVGGNQSPAVSQINDLLRLTDIGAIHYHSYNANPLSLSRELYAMLENVEKKPAIMQLNAAWPDPSAINYLQSQGIEVVLQCPSSTLDDSFDAKIAQYQGVEYCLIDPSGGVGKTLDKYVVRDFLKRAEKRLPNTRIGFAGGLCEENVKEIYQFMDGNYFFDAQGKLRTNQELDLKKVEAYIQQASKVIQR